MTHDILNGQQIIDKLTDVTYKLTDLNKKEIFQHRKNILPITQKSTRFENLLNYTLLQDLKSSQIVQNKTKIKTLIHKSNKNN